MGMDSSDTDDMDNLEFRFLFLRVFFLFVFLQNNGRCMYLLSLMPDE